MKLPNLFRRKQNKKNKKLLEEYKKGRILQVDNNINNKEFLKSK